MTAKELLEPRFEVIAEYPHHSFKEGDVLVMVTDELYHTDKSAEWDRINICYLERYPHLFRKMNWWEGREVNDMPSKLLLEGDIFIVERWVANRFEYKVCEWLKYDYVNGLVPYMPID